MSFRAVARAPGAFCLWDDLGRRRRGLTVGRGVSSGKQGLARVAGRSRDRFCEGFCALRDRDD
jgi:hypothetical protein